MKISVIGAGAMGGALVVGLLKSDTILAGDITVADPTEAKLVRYAEQGASVTTDNAIAAQGSDIVAVVVKPWIVQRVIEEIKPVLDYKKQMLVVVAAGVKSEQISGWLDDGAGVLPFFLVIPNIAIAEKQSMTFIVPVGASDSQTATVKAVFDELGGSIVTEERLLAAGTTLASCGIAYAMRYVRASVEGGVEMGFKAADAEKIVLQTVRGAVELLQATGQHPEAAIDQVTTPGGVTIKGLNEMEHAGFTSAVIRGLKAGL
ncbi:MAG: pyrroline-5-carboxylate reductase dimerization domain-containing protein [Prevotella sp.]|nr:pyrroline-5-carboxylate reductase dimerization domain-containing protein [Prevotella sp.]